MPPCIHACIHPCTVFIIIIIVGAEAPSMSASAVIIIYTAEGSYEGWSTSSTDDMRAFFLQRYHKVSLSGDPMVLYRVTKPLHASLYVPTVYLSAVKVSLRTSCRHVGVPRTACTARITVAFNSSTTNVVPDSVVDPRAATSR